MEQRLQELEEICSYLERERTVYLKDHRNAEFQERVIEKHRERLSWCQDYIKKQIKERKELEAELEQYKPKEDWYSE